MKLSGGCNCGQVRYELDGEPVRVGICHCETCRKGSGSAFSFFGIWPRAGVILSGDLGCWQSRAGGERFCPGCGSPLFCWAEGSDQIEIKLGTLDSPPSALVPAYELWTIRREPWLAHQKGAEQHVRDREGGGPLTPGELPTGQVPSPDQVPASRRRTARSRNPMTRAVWSGRK